MTTWSTRPFRVVASMLLVILTAACGDAGPETALEIREPATDELTVGELLMLTVTASGEAGVVTWTSSDPSVASVTAGTVEALRPGPVTITASAPDALPDEISLMVVARPGGYTADQIDYFTEIAFGAEFGGASPLLRRWRFESGPLIRVNGAPSPGDRVVVDSVVAEINRLAPLDIEVVTDSPTVELHFVPQAQFPDILPQAPPGNIGLVWVWWDASQHIFQSVVLIATDVEESLRAHLIREELTQMLGLLRDSFRFPESIFYQSFSTVTEYLPIDRTVIELLHRPELVVGMTREEAARGARLLLRADAPAHAAGVVPDRAHDGFGPGGVPVDRRAPGSAGSGIRR